MRPLAERVAALVGSDGLGVHAACAALGQPSSYIRAAFLTAAERGLAVLVREGPGRRGALRLYPVGTNVRPCIICGYRVTSARKGTKTCSRSCARKMSWSVPGRRARHSRVLKAVHATPKVKARLRSAVRTACQRPEESAARSERVRKTWADPERAARRRLGLRNAWARKEASARRAKFRCKKLSLWADPIWRAKTVRAMRTGRRGRFKRAVIDVLASHPEMPDEQIAAHIGLSLKQTKVLMRKLYRDGIIGRKPQDGRHRKHSPEQILARTNRRSRAKATRTRRLRLAHSHD